MAKDRFSSHAASYAAFRPLYPGALYEFVLAQVTVREYAWDCATGNGQVARDLAPHFHKVYATDISANQLSHAVQLPNIEYSVAPADQPPFPDSFFDLITVGQAIHWFDIPAFYKSANRVAKPGAVIAVWGYGLLSISPSIDAVISDFYFNIIGPFWDQERKLIDQHYKTIPFPFREMQTPFFDFSFEWTLDELKGYLQTWSSVRKYMETNAADPVLPLLSKLRPLWIRERLKVVFPLFLRLGRC